MENPFSKIGTSDCKYRERKEFKEAGKVVYLCRNPDAFCDYREGGNIVDGLSILCILDIEKV